MKQQPPKRKPGRPATGQIPQRIFRMDNESWQMIQAAAELSGETLSEYIRRVILRDANRVLKQAE